MSDTQLLTLQSCAQAVRSAASRAGERDAAGSRRALDRAERLLSTLQGELPHHARRMRLARSAVERCRSAVQAAEQHAGVDSLLKLVTAAQRAAEHAAAP